MWVFKLGVNLNLGFYIRFLLVFNISFNFIWKKCFEVYCFKIKCIRKRLLGKEDVIFFFVYVVGIEYICVGIIYCDDWFFVLYYRVVWREF